MDIITLNKIAWDVIGEDTASPYMAQKWYSAVFRKFCSHLKKGAAVLDIGCGPGVPLTRALVDQGYVVTALDFSPRMVSIAQHNVPAAKKFLCMSMTDLNVAGEYDGAVASYSLLCLDPIGFSSACQKIARALKPRGVCFVALNENRDEHALAKQSLATIAGQKMYTRAYAEQEIRAAFEGMQVLDLKREVVYSSMYGREHSIILLLQKIPPR